MSFSYSSKMLNKLRQLFHHHHNDDDESRLAEITIERLQHVMGYYNLIVDFAVDDEDPDLFSVTFSRGTENLRTWCAYAGEDRTIAADRVVSLIQIIDTLLDNLNRMLESDEPNKKNLRLLSHVLNALFAQT